MKRLAIVFLLAVSPACAADFASSITDLQGKTVTEKDLAGKDVSITLAQICTNALLATFNDEQALAATEKVARFKLAVKIAGAGEVNLSADDTALVKKVVAKMYGPLVVGRVFQLLDPESMK